MSGISAIQAINPAETWQAWLQANTAEEAQAAEPAEAAPEQAPIAAPAAIPSTPATRPVDMPVLTPQLADAASVVLPLGPALLQPLHLQNGPELRWRVQDSVAWRALFDNVDDGAPQQQELPQEGPTAAVDPLPAWTQALLDRLREAATAPSSAAALRPALQAWRVGLPVLLACPAGLVSLQASPDAASWQWRRWPARWRSARPATSERWWAVRLALGTQGRPRTLRDLTGAATLAPGRVSCELRLEDVAPGIAQWTEVLVHAPAAASLRTLLGARPSLTWLLCNQALWPREAA